MITIIDYGMGNLRSVQKAFEYIGLKCQISNKSEEIEQTTALVLPGVGSFGDAMNNLNQSGLAKLIIDKIIHGYPFLGICLGFQVLFSVSYEEGEYKGLDIFPGEVVRLPDNVKVPHMGWNDIIKKDNSNPLFEGVQGGEFFYFVHSYYVMTNKQDIVSTWTDYGLRFASSVRKGNVFGVQFHPEKSSRWGLKILENFGGICNDYFSGG